ncbi:MAG TPA: hypothetical protein VMW91_02245 [Desulfosporosinus sp.]|nr:hypothetical protein [Desulfosporosinus sp.]
MTEGACKHFPPSPPGDTIRDIMIERGRTRFELARLLHITDIQTHRLLDGKFPIDNDMAHRLSEVLGSSPAFWADRERQYRERVEKPEREQKPPFL